MHTASFLCRHLHLIIVSGPSTQTTESLQVSSWHSIGDTCFHVECMYRYRFRTMCTATSKFSVRQHIWVSNDVEMNLFASVYPRIQTRRWCLRVWALMCWRMPSGATMLASLPTGRLVSGPVCQHNLAWILVHIHVLSLHSVEGEGGGGGGG